MLPHPALASHTVAIIGGGFTGAAVAFHLACTASSRTRILVFEPRRVLGCGLAYDTDNPVHRINVTAQRMSLLPEDNGDFARWIDATGACADDPEAFLPDGRIFPRRAVFGRYVAARLTPFLAAGRISHITERATRLSRGSNGWFIACDHGLAHADTVVLALGNPLPIVPAPIALALQGDPRLIADPNAAGALDAIGPQDRVLVIGTGLTMADVVASLDRRGHRGPIHAVSRRGQRAHGHAAIVTPPVGSFVDLSSCTARGLLRQVRARVAQGRKEGLDWHPVFDTLRIEAQTIWAALPLTEQRRLLCHLRPYWETHRHRVAPQLNCVLEHQAGTGSLLVQAASIVAARRQDNALAVTLRPRGHATTVEAFFDAIIVTTGSAPASLTRREPFIAELVRARQLAPDPTSLGLACDRLGRALDASGAPQLDLLIAGPLARGIFGELTAVAEIACQAADLAAQCRVPGVRRKAAAF
ncbi:FAD/NAD(P)-binding protein [Acidocella sp.]|jgi:uncharacterized NAD(P)/FAD-binding protein YdhS|uniref:FAD/NAD(P)-binding protein n=1 Tax=Acidocella sp. TaxID=50710 RepID=UPI002F3F27F1